MHHAERHAAKCKSVSMAIFACLYHSAFAVRHDGVGWGDFPGALRKGSLMRAKCYSRFYLRIKVLPNCDCLRSTPDDPSVPFFCPTGKREFFFFSFFSKLTI